MDNNNFMKAFTNEFPKIRIDLVKTEEPIGVHVFFFKVEEEADLKKYWERLTSYIAVNYQPQLPEEYDIWNIYLIFITPTKISKSLKYKIENDTFSCRKINKTKEEVTSLSYSEIIDSILIHKDFLKNNEEKHKSFEYRTKNRIIDKAIESANILGQTNSAKENVDKILNDLYSYFEEGADENK